eukprot:1537466-Prymnesium_polylepis.1
MRWLGRDRHAVRTQLGCGWDIAGIWQDRAGWAKGRSRIATGAEVDVAGMQRLGRSWDVAEVAAGIWSRQGLDGVGQGRVQICSQICSQTELFTESDARAPERVELDCQGHQLS